MKCTAIVDIHNLLILNVYNEIPSSILIPNFAGDRNEILSGTNEGWAGKDTGMRGIATRNFNDLDMPMQVEKDKVCLVGLTIVMTDNRIELRGSWIAIMDIIHNSLPPGEERTNKYEQYHGSSRAK